MTSTDTLLPCPFCGGEPVLTEHPPHEHSPILKRVMPDFPDHKGSADVSCLDCAVGHLRDTPTKAIAAWNRRTPPTPAAEEREAVAQWCSGCHEVRSVDCYRAGCPKSDTERRAAEILAAEANERARIVAWLRAEAEDARKRRNDGRSVHSDSYKHLDSSYLALVCAATSVEHGAGK